MPKFTIFTVILTILVVVVSAEIVVNKYLPTLGDEDGLARLELSLPDDLNLDKIIQTNVLGADQGTEETSKLGSDVDFDAIPDDEKEKIARFAENQPDQADEIDELGLGALDLDEYVVEGDNSDDFEFSSGFSTETNSGTSTGQTSTSSTSNNQTAQQPERSDGLDDFEDRNFAGSSTNVYLREEQVRSAGFADAYLEDEQDYGFLFKTIQIGDLFDVEVVKTAIRNDESLFAKVYTFKIGPNSAVNEVYNVLKLRASEAVDTTINETNTYGQSSFYMNDGSRSATAFLVVKLGNVIYGFSYPKDYHAQIKNLIKLLEWEFK